MPTCTPIDGARAERVAGRYLIRRGWAVLARNWRGAGGELDLVARRGGVVAVGEVKARSREAALEEPLTAAQRARIVRAATAFLAGRPELARDAVRFDLLAVRRRPGPGRVRHVAAAFEPGPAGYPPNRRRAG